MCSRLTTSELSTRSTENDEGFSNQLREITSSLQPAAGWKELVLSGEVSTLIGAQTVPRFDEYGNGFQRPAGSRWHPWIFQPTAEYPSQPTRSESNTFDFPAVCGLNEPLQTRCLSGLRDVRLLEARLKRISALSDKRQCELFTKCLFRSWLEQFPAVGCKNTRSRLEIAPQRTGNMDPQLTGVTSAVDWKFTRSALERNHCHLLHFLGFTGLQRF